MNRSNEERGHIVFPNKKRPLDSGNLTSKKRQLDSQSSKAIATLDGIYYSDTSEIEKRILELMESSNASINEEEFLRSKGRPKNFGIKKIRTRKVKTYLKKTRTALKRLEDGGTMEDAKVDCPPEAITELRQWKRQLEGYLSPFLYGSRYTSFGRHFTKVEKLQEIVDRLRWYVTDGDTIVDFCCGSNDFSCLMKDSLDRMGKKCSFKNYDLIQSKNDFSFEKKDWLEEVNIGDLPRGHNLIMGLSPPFGALANKFINRALQFNPKLLILIAPEEAARLDQRKVPYELIWKDEQLLSGKSFYLPGSVDAHGKPLESWNAQAPPLCLWSHPQWAALHRSIAAEKGHIQVEENDMGMSRKQFNSARLP